MAEPIADVGYGIGLQVGSPSTEDAVDDDIMNGLGQRYWAIMSGKRTGGKKEDHQTVDQFRKVMRFLECGV